MKEISRTEITVVLILAQAELVAQMHQLPRMITQSPNEGAMRQTMKLALSVDKGIKEVERMRCEHMRFIPELRKLDGWQYLIRAGEAD